MLALFKLLQVWQSASTKSLGTEEGLWYNLPGLSDIFLLYRLHLSW